MAEAKTRPFLKSSSDRLMGLLPEDLEQQVMSKIKKATPGEEPKEPPTAPQAPAR